MLNEVLEGLKGLFAVAPDVAVNAGLLFLTLGVLKGLGILKKESWVQFGNIFVAWLMSGGAVPEDFADAQEWYMTVVLAAGMFQVYKWIRDNKGIMLSTFKRLKSVEVPEEDRYGK